MSSRPAKAAELALLIVAGLAALPGCSRRPGSPPTEAFDVRLELTPKPGKPVPVTPRSVLGPARVWINQETPRQKKTPEWRVVQAKDGPMLDLSPDGKWRCLVNPVRAVGRAGEDGSVDRWTTARTLRCSSDGWSTYVEGLVGVTFDENGKRTENDPRAALYLKDVVGGQPRSTVVVLDSEIPERPPGH